MSSFCQRSVSPGAFIAICILTLLSSCGPTHPAYFQSQRNAIQRTNLTTFPVTTATDTVPIHQEVSGSSSETMVATLPTATTSPTGSLMKAAASEHTPAVVNVSRHRNPDSYHNQRFSRWFHSLPIAHVAPRTHAIDRNSTSRKTYKLALVALGLAVLSFSSLFVAGGTLMWVLGVTLPLTATLLGVASLTTIRRNRDRYRGKGWAMAAIMLGTGVLGLALVALAALSVSETINR
ncbi:DUF4190 domain-containing protein [Spirosoma endbachense]|uniref:DUF4190 domain-containing protein n=1 Tax=Spirosoma endbachense TaxID=2666025 RepID=A0A6P1W2S1_9BACT|nr:DUF4190 domain-containing protein [Spirosoma endbachense]QHV98848.1 hypothetical protein GJR95_29280 [Spirosoma endbachense]